MFKKILFFAITIAAVSCQSTEEVKREQYFSEGYQLYTTHCTNCHQADGKGMANLYPPINGASLVIDKAKFACIIKNGMKDTIVVNGRKFSRPMPPNPRLTDLEIAEIITFVGIKWQKDSVYTHTDFVAKSLENCK